MKTRGLRAAAALTGLVALGAGAAWALSSGTPEGGWRAWLRQPAFALRRVDFIGARALDPAQLWHMAEVEAGRALIDVDPREIKRRLAAHPRISEVRVARLPPGRLLIGIREREPLAVDLETLEGLDALGARFPLDPAEVEALPKVRGDAAQALRVLAAAHSFEIELAAVEAGPDSANAEPAGDDLRLRLGSDPRRDLENWLRLRSSGLLARHQAREIDLRFEGSAVLRDFPNPDEEGTPDGSQR